jgi:K+-transporting ATPase ATPase C chain
MKTSLSAEVLRALRATLVIAVIGGLIYPLVMTGLAQGLFHDQANGGLITTGNKVVGAKLIGQNFTSDKYFNGRPSATVDENDSTKSKPYNAANSGGDNLAPSNKALIDVVAQRVEAVRKANPTLTGDVPIDLVTTDFSGFDPDITKAAAMLQVDRVAKARGVDPAKVRSLVDQHVDAPSFGIFGVAHVNVLALNLALDAMPSS